MMNGRRERSEVQCLTPGAPDGATMPVCGNVRTNPERSDEGDGRG